MLFSAPDISGQSACPISWQLLSSSGPAPRYIHAMAYDSQRDVVVLHGGLSSSSVTLSDTWEWDGISWSLVSTLGPDRRGHSMVFDDARGLTVLFGGNDGAGQYLNDTWVWDGTIWTQTCSVCPPAPRHGAMAAYDRMRGETLIFGGWSPDGLLSDTWAWDGTTWTSVATSASPAARSWGGACYDSSRDRMIVFGGNLEAIDCGMDSNETWELDRSTSLATWIQIPVIGPSPSARHHTAMAFDPSRGTALLYGGTDNCTTSHADTWEYDGENWSLLFGASPPGSLHGHGMTFDMQDQRCILFGGTQYGAGSPIGTTWGTVCPPMITSISPPAVDALIPGTAQTVSIIGTGFGPGTLVSVNGLPLSGFPAPFTIVSPTLITLDMPQVPNLGPNAITVGNGQGSATGYVDVVEPALPKLQCNSGDTPATAFTFSGLDVTMSSLAGDSFFLLWSPSSAPSVVPGLVELSIGNNFTSLYAVESPFLPSVIGPVSAWTSVHFPLVGLYPGANFFVQGVVVRATGFTLPLGASNAQEVFVLF